ncbi:MAG TPA: hypothetical protein VIS04_05990 [Woeseiaceae bacterium]
MAAEASLAALSAVACAFSIAAVLAQPDASPRQSTIAPTFITVLFIIQSSSVGEVKQLSHYLLNCAQLQWIKTFLQ